MLHGMKTGFLCIVLMAMAVLWNCSCGHNPAEAKRPEVGVLEMQVQLINGMGKVSSVKKTGFDSLVIEISADDMETIRKSRSISSGQLFTIDTLPDIPVGSGRCVRVTTINTAGDVIHEDSSGVHTVKIDPNSFTVLPVVLVPLKGSIYLQLAGIPTSVDSVSAVFTASDGTKFRTVAARSARVYLSLDGILHNTKGTLVVAGTTVSADTLYKAGKEITVDARSGTSVQLSFDSYPGGVSLAATMMLPGATLVTGSMGAVPVAAVERGDLLITEIMYAANDSEYIEVYNPSELKVIFDTLIINIDGKERFFSNVAIEPKSYYVFGRIKLPWADVAHSVSGALDLVSGGNWITVSSKNREIIDQVIFTGGNNGLEWPKVSGKQSVCLAAAAYGSVANNFGRNWAPATSPIAGTSTQMGTPHAL